MDRPARRVLPASFARATPVQRGPRQRLEQRGDSHSVPFTVLAKSSCSLVGDLFRSSRSLTPRSDSHK